MAPDLDARVRSALAAHEPSEAPDFPSPVPRVDAGVLVPLHLEGEPRVTMTVRNGALRHHGGEVCFPGGKRDPSDSDLSATALREAEEEIGLAPERARLVGRLSTIPTATSHFRLHPFVALVDGGAPSYRLSGEVERTLELEVRALVDGTIPFRAAPFAWAGGEVLAPWFEIDARTTIWGATAFVLAELLRVIAPALGLALDGPEIVSTFPATAPKRPSHL